MENIQFGLLLMVVGMTTVFLILFIVIHLGKALIAFVNKYVPEEVATSKKTSPASARVAAVSPQDSAAIASAINILTGGKGKVVKIEKL